MITVILFGAKKERETGKALREALSKNGGVLHIFKEELTSNSQQEKIKYLLFETENAPILSMNSGILIFKNEIVKYSHFHIPQGFTAVVDSENAPALNLLKSQGIPTLICGLSSHDTLSISSVSEDSAAVSLQRDIRCLNGNQVESCEIPIHFSFPMDKYAMLCCCAVLLLSNTETQSELKI